MSFLNWQSDGALAFAALAFYGLVLLALALRALRRSRALSKLAPRAVAWRLVVWLAIGFWLLPYYVRTSGTDAYAYHQEGMTTAQEIRSGAWNDVSWGLSSKAIPVITGFLYAPLGADIYGTLFFSALLGLCGGLYACRAFSLWASPGRLRRYSLMILFLPSFTVWTSTFGKDSWVMFGLGLSAYGYSSILKSHSLRRLPHLLSGLAVVTLVRPHIAVTVAASMAWAYFFGLAYGRDISLLSKLARTVALIGISVVLAALVYRFLGWSDISLNSVQDYARDRSAVNAAGGSVVEVDVAPGVGGMLLAFPRGIVRILFEPFPWEIKNLTGGMAAAENLLIAWFLVTRITRVRDLFRGIVRKPYLLFSATLAGALLLMFSFVPNLGLLSRQRCQLLPFLFAALLGGASNKRAAACAREPAPLLVALSER